MRAQIGKRGVALAAVVFGLVVLGALLLSSFVIAMWEQRLGESSARVHHARAASESGALQLLAQWNYDSMRALPVYPGDPYDVPERVSPGGGGRFAGRIRRLTRTLYVIAVEGEPDGSTDPAIQWRGAARSRTGLLVGLRPLTLPVRAALATRGPVALSGTAIVDGRDHVPNQSWTDCAPADTARPGLLTVPGAPVTVVDDAAIDGAPPVTPDPLVQGASFTTFGDETYSELSARAHIHLAGGVILSTAPVVTAAGECDMAATRNWGNGRQRDRPCGEHFPLIHVAGDAQLVGGQGQGILLVDGDLTLSGSYAFFGVVVVRGAVKTGVDFGSDAQVFGAVMTHALRGAGATLSGWLRVTYSKCVIDRALAEWGRAVPLSSRAVVTLH